MILERFFFPPFDGKATGSGSVQPESDMDKTEITTANTNKKMAF